MNILFVASHLPYPLHSGGQVRVYNLLKRLSQMHEISLFTFLRSDAELANVGKLNFCRRVDTVFRGHAWQPKYVLRSLFSTYPFLFSTYAISEMKKKIAREISRQHYDLVHIEPSYVWPALPQVSIPVVVCEHNIEYLGYKGYVERFSIIPLRPFLGLDVMKLMYWERIVWKEATRIITVSDEDRNIIGLDKIDVVPNGVDLAEFPFKPQKKYGKEPIFLFVGNFSWMQNRDAVNYLISHIWPHLKLKYPQSRLRIVGRSAPEDFIRRVRGSGAQLLEGVVDINKEYQASNILIAPIRIGSGSRYKILEAMASGLPVITTSIGAGGLGVQSGRDLMIAETPEDFLMASQTLLSNPKLCTSIAKSARSLIEKSYSWEIIARKLEEVWEKVQ